MALDYKKILQRALDNNLVFEHYQSLMVLKVELAKDTPDEATVETMKRNINMLEKSMASVGIKNVIKEI